jgi:hypothetical protein
VFRLLQQVQQVRWVAREQMEQTVLQLQTVLPVVRVQPEALSI